MPSSRVVHRSVEVVRKLVKSSDFRTIVRFCEGAGKIIAVGTVVVTSWLWISAIPERTHTAHYAAWQVIAQAQAQPGSAGRVDALESLAGDHVPLDGVNVRGAYLYELKLRNASLKDAVFSKTHLRHAAFDGSDISGADFREISVERAKDDRQATDISFRNARLREARFDGGSLGAADFTLEHRKNPEPGLAGDDGERDYHVSFAGAKAIYGSNFSGREFDSAEFVGAELPDAQFTNAALRETDARWVELSDADFSGTLLFFVDFANSCLDGVSFRGATLVGVNFSGAYFGRKTDFRGARIDVRERAVLLRSLSHAQNPLDAMYDPALEKELKRMLSSHPTLAVPILDTTMTALDKLRGTGVATFPWPSGVPDSVTFGLGVYDASREPGLFQGHVPKAILCLNDDWGSPNGQDTVTVDSR